MCKNQDQHLASQSPASPAGAPCTAHWNQQKIPYRCRRQQDGFLKVITVDWHSAPTHAVPAKSWRKDTTDKLHKAHCSISQTTAVSLYHWIFHCLISMSIPSCCTDTLHYPTLKWRKLKGRISSSWKLSPLHSHNPYSSTSPFQTFVQIDKAKVKGLFSEQLSVKSQKLMSFQFPKLKQRCCKLWCCSAGTAWDSEKTH